MSSGDKNQLKLGQLIKAEVQLVKDYGIITQIKSKDESIKTGFILNDHKLGQKYKPGQTVHCRVMDIDQVKKIADLKEVKADTADEDTKTFKEGAKVKAIVELNKEGYLVLALKNARHKLGICKHTFFNQDDSTKGDFLIGEELETKVHAFNETAGLFELVHLPKPAKKAGLIAQLKEGVKFTGVIRSIKAQCLYV